MPATASWTNDEAVTNVTLLSKDTILTKTHLGAEDATATTKTASDGVLESAYEGLQASVAIHCLRDLATMMKATSSLPQTIAAI